VRVSVLPDRAKALPGDGFNANGRQPIYNATEYRVLLLTFVESQSVLRLFSEAPHSWANLQPRQRYGATMTSRQVTIFPRLRSAGLRGARAVGTAQMATVTVKSAGDKRSVMVKRGSEPKKTSREVRTALPSD
jgi:hypothetical protein